MRALLIKYQKTFTKYLSRTLDFLNVSKRKKEVKEPLD